MDETCHAATIDDFNTLVIRVGQIDKDKWSCLLEDIISCILAREQFVASFDSDEGVDEIHGSFYSWNLYGKTMVITCS